MDSSVAVIGATGRTGVEVVKALVTRGIPVRALARDLQKAQGVFPPDHPLITVVKGALDNLEALGELLKSCRAVIIASGTLSPFSLFNTGNSPYHVDYLGVKNVIAALSDSPRVVLVSTVGLTRPWRLVSFVLDNFGGGVMKWKAEGEHLVRDTDLSYAIIRPAILQSSVVGSWTEGSQRTSQALVADQGDKIDGRIERHDLALLCVEAALAEKGTLPEQCTFEVIASNRKVNDTCSEPSNSPQPLFRHLRAEH